MTKTDNWVDYDKSYFIFRDYRGRKELMGVENGIVFLSDNWDKGEYKMFQIDRVRHWGFWKKMWATICGKNPTDSIYLIPRK